MEQREKLIELLSQYFTIGNSDEYSLLRDKSAFALGTMSLDDFVEFDEEKVADIADHLLANGVVVLPCKVGDTVYSMLDDIGKVHACEITMIVLKGRGVGKTPVLDTVCLKPTDYSGGEYGAAFGSFGKTIFLTKEEAEEALAKRKGGDE